MKKSAMVTVLVVGFLLITVVPSFAWWHRGWWGPPYPYWYGPRYFVVAPAPVVVTPPPVVESPPAFVQQEPAQGYWYFCPSSQAYYPNVQSCPEAWVKVPPRSQ
ncbi:MAG: hypothetical protein DMD75_19590 [Candidatus Rokuibacteriota bacterium]|nr:MAG: hypothetical protein DMD75_19590 [Candidatus Rokubacteria bacterium]